MQERLRKHVTFLAETIGERNVWHPRQLAAAADYIEAALTQLDYQVARQGFEVEGLTVCNLEARSKRPAASGEIVLVGAHYDSVIGSPGANDNGSGVAALIEMARALSDKAFARNLRLVAFVNEEPPFFRTRQMGSRVYARRARQRGEKIAAMLCLETIGYYTDRQGSQHYPFPLGFFYPGTGNFIGFVGNFSSRKLLIRIRNTFRRHSAFPCQAAAAPSWLPGIGWSDHWSFWVEGYPAIMVTDTAPYRYPYYHTSEDTPEKIDYARLVRVVEGLVRVVCALAS